MNDGGSAFPVAYQQGKIPMDSKHEFAGGTWSVPAQSGMTLRDYFAAQAIVPLCRDETLKNLGTTFGSALRNAAIAAYEIADAMLEQRSKK